MPISVIIPAHNEASVIDRCLQAITSAAAPGELDVIVVANACADDTADRARRYAPTVRVIETPIGSKSNALNLGDQAASGFPRFYVDADVVMSIDALRATASVLAEGDVLAAAPSARFDLAGCGFCVRAFYRIWSLLPYMRQGMIGSGVYAVSEVGRRRFERFPAITADDAFVRMQFSAQERLTISDQTFTVTAPRSLWGLIKIKTRAHFGNVELLRQFPQLGRNENAHHGGALKSLARSPKLWPSLAVYMLVRVVSKALAYRRFYFGDHRHWERDESSRLAATPANAG